MAEIPLVEIAKLKDILQDLAETRLELEANLTELETSLAVAPLAEQVKSQNEDAVQVQELERELQTVKTQLDVAKSERDEARREILSLRDRVEHAIQQSTTNVYRAIDRQDPFEQLQQLKKGKREADKKNTTLSAENRQMQSSLREVRTRVQELEAAAVGYRSEMESQASQLQRLNGLASRYADEIARHASQMEVTRKETQQAILRDMIHRVTPRRMADLMDAFDDTARHIDANRETAQFVEWLLQHLHTIGLRITHRAEEQILINEEELHAFQLDEEYREGDPLRVTTPGFALGEDIIIRAKVRYFERKDNDGGNENGHDVVGEEVSGCIETHGASGNGNLADDQEERS